MEREVKKKGIDAFFSTGSGSAQPEAGLEVEVLISFMKKYCSVPDTSLNELKDKYAFETGSVLAEQLSLILAGSPYSTRSARGKSISAHDGFFQEGYGGCGESNRQRDGP